MAICTKFIPFRSIAQSIPTSYLNIAKVLSNASSRYLVSIVQKSLKRINFVHIAINISLSRLLTSLHDFKNRPTQNCSQETGDSMTVCKRLSATWLLARKRSGDMKKFKASRSRDMHKIYLIERLLHNGDEMPGVFVT